MGLDLLRRRVHTQRGTRRLSARDVEILRYLLRHVNQVVSRKQLERDVWGMAESVQSEAVAIGLRRLRGKVEDDPAKPRFLLNVHGVGWQLLLGEAPEAEVHTNLGAILDGFEPSADWTELSKSSDRWLTLVGPAGIGKTRLARRRALNALESGEVDEAWEVELSGSVDAEGLRDALGAVLGVPGPAIERTLVARGRVLLLLDGADALDDGALAEVVDLAGEVPRMRIMATAPTALGVRSEVCLGVNSLELEAAIRLLRVRIAEAGRRDVDDAHLARVAEAVEGVPLALELCAARARVVPLDRLTVPAATEVALEALRWSWRALEPNLRATLAQCAVFKAPFELEAAEAVVRIPDCDVVDLLVQLTEHGLLGIDPREPRFTMRQRLRQAVSIEADAETVERHRLHFMEWAHARRAELIGPLGWRAVAALTASEPDVFAALEQCSGAERAAMATALAGFLSLSGRPERRLAMLQQDVSDLEEPLRTRFLSVKAHVCTVLGRFDEAREILARAAPGDPYALREQAFIHVAVVDDEAARVALEKALVLGIDDPMFRVSLYVDMGLVETRAGNPGEAEACYRRGFAILGSLGNRTHTPRVRNQLAQHHCYYGDFEAALELVDGPFDPEEAGRSSAGLGACLRGIALGGMGRNEEGVAALRAGIALSLRMGEADRASFGLMTLADLLIELERIDEAEQCAIEALELATDAVHRCGARTVQASVARWSGAWRVAARALTQMLELTEAGPITCHAHSTLSTVLAAQGQLDEAKRHLALAREALETTGDPVAFAKVEIAEAAVAHALGDPAPAQVLLERTWEGAELRIERELLARHLDFVREA